MGLNKTQNIGLNNWLGNEFPKRSDFANDNVIIDAEIQALKDTVGSGLTATNVTIADVDNKFTSPTVEGALLEAINKADSAFQSASNGKTTIATAIGSPVVNTDTFVAMGTKIDTLTQTLKTNLTSKGQTFLETDKMSTLINKITGITIESLGGKKWANGTFTAPSGTTPRFEVITNLAFTPSLIFCIANDGSASLYLYTSAGARSIYGGIVSNLSTILMNNTVDTAITVNTITSHSFFVNGTNATNKGYLIGNFDWYAFQ